MIDAHQHFWKFNSLKQAWITDEMAALKTDSLPHHLMPLLKEQGIKGCVAVQADESEEENEFLLNLAQENSFIKGVVGWLDFLSEDISDRLDYYSQFKLMKGFRYILQGQQQRDIMLSDAFKNNIQLLSKHQFTYDILIFPDQLKYVTKLVAAFPNQPFILDHIAKPFIKSGEINEWKNDISELVKHENVYCKVSGLITEADWQNWKYEDFLPYLDIVFEVFGANRLLFGSDWPVCNVAGAYQKMISIVQQYTSSLTKAEQAAFWGDNAVKFYHLA
ncbi:amidohydrolase family protein [Pedobacter cryophilus]|uniref:Amidohydrolase n=1 Tax=Pedobacter cryophilus TaxID=2571271 RepID=A0A4U1C276_9SPHI|nr:amidohydrolase family protein [Pedobacter cryophilus]TKB99215.1 amidohydrolase [Pedobacter cryophilus]